VALPQAVGNGGASCGAATNHIPKGIKSFSPVLVRWRAVRKHLHREIAENRHPMSQTVRTEVSPQSQAWGYSLGSVYIRKVHYRNFPA